LIPIILDGSKLDILLIGRGAAFDKRLAWLREGGACRLAIFCDEPGKIVPPRGAGECFLPHLPEPADLALAGLVWIAGLPHGEAAILARQARELGVLVNVEDDLPLCDFHTPALVRRGDLLVSISTAGKSPGLAQRLKVWLESQLSADWSERLETLARKRAAWRRRTRSLEEVASLTGAMIDSKGWLTRTSTDRKSRKEAA
jgi:precorrin-2 dehydrogenase/sirohydrochlorin ferrochelatase